LGWAVLECPFQFLALGIVQTGREVQDAIGDIVSLEVGLATGEVQEAAGREAAVLEEHESDAPTASLDWLVAAATSGLARGRALAAIDAREASVLERATRRALESVPIGHVYRFTENLEERLGPLVRRADRMKPERHLALGKRIGETFAET
jgi:hypothetical protein